MGARSYDNRTQEEPRVPAPSQWLTPHQPSGGRDRPSANANLSETESPVAAYRGRPATMNPPFCARAWSSFHSFLPLSGIRSR